MEVSFQRVLIVNRGEPAMRLIHAVREFNRERNAELKTIALFTDADRRAMFVREADEAVYLGAATFVDQRDGARKVSYLDYGRLERALREAGAEAAWVGWGFVAEQADFADLCRELGVVFIGPPAEVMRSLGDKITSKRLAEQAGVPVAAWSGGPVDTAQGARDHAARLGYPLMIKATAGGGGRGIRRVHAPRDLEEAFDSARAEARQSFGDSTVFLERVISGARHVEVQVIGDRYGTVWALGVRDCTIQRRNQKIVEEAPSPILSEEEDLELREAAARLAREVGYENAGTVEFLFDPQDRSCHFMEVNARLQVEHPVTEMTTGLDLVKLQIEIAQGGRLEGEPPAQSGHAVEVRLNAEDAASGFAPAPGTVELFRLPTGPGIRVDTGVQEGDAVPHEFDSMIAKIIAHGQDREEALARLHRALRECAVVVRGGTSNKGFLLGLLERPELRSGEVDVGWLEELVQQEEHLSIRHADVALLQAAIEVYQLEIEVEKARFLVTAGRGRPEVSDKIGRTVELRYRGNSYELMVSRLGVHHFRIAVDGQRVDVTVEPQGRGQSRSSVGPTTYTVLSVVQGLTHLVEVDGVPHRISRDQGGIVRSPAPAVVVSLAVKEGDEVETGDRLATIEAMKMEMPVVAEFTGRVRKLMVMENIQLGSGDPLMVIEPSGDTATGTTGERVRFAAMGATAEEEATTRSQCLANLAELRCVLRGFDVDSTELERLVAERQELCGGVPAADPEMHRREEELLSIFVDICSLFRRHPDGDELEDGGRLSTAEYFYTYLRDIDAQGENLPEGFVSKLLRALSHYGVDDLERTPELEGSLFRLWRSHQRMAEQTLLVMSILGRWLENYEDLSPLFRDSLRQLLDRTIVESRDRFPAVHDSAREVRYRYFDKDLLEEARWEIYAQAEAHLAYLDSRPDAVDREERIAALVDCPQPLKSLISSQFAEASPALREAMLEVMTRRYYRIRSLGPCRMRTIEDQPFACFEYDRRGKGISLVTTHSSFDELATSFARVSKVLEAAPPESDIAIDFYAWRGDRQGDTESTLEHLLALLAEADFSRPIRRLVVAISSPEGGLGLGDVEHFTFRQSEAGFEEERLYRGLHPMLGKRLQLWRLSNFEIERLPSRQDLYLFHGLARENPKDERLFALAEVRDLTPVRDDSGQIIGLPLLEHMFMEAMAGIRRYQSERSPRQRLQWNRVLLYVWPPFELTADELNALINRLMPETEGLGLDKVLVRARIRDPQSGRIRVSLLDITNPGGTGAVLRFRKPAMSPIRPLTEYKQKVVGLRRRGLVYPYELIKMMTPERVGVQADFPAGEFVEHDLDGESKLAPVERPYGENQANVVVGMIRNFTPKYPEGMSRVIVLGDPSRGMGSLAEPECRRIIAALDLAERSRIPLEWFAVSAGARISMDSGTENMDWIARVLRRLVEYTQAGGEVNMIVHGVNVGAQPYWNAEATMLQHTRGILIMTPQGSMVLTGKKALEYSGGISAEDNQGIGGYERIMGVNGQGQYFARDVKEACDLLMRYYDHSYVQPGERFPRRALTIDPPERDVGSFRHGPVDDNGFSTVAEIFSAKTNPGRKLPFDIRKVMRAVSDQDHEPLERWYGMRAAENAVVWDIHLGGYPACLIGIESKPLPRLGFAPADGPSQWTAGTLFPLSSKKVARAINACSRSRPLVVLANLSGFDGSPDSMRNLQLEYGAEIGRAIVNFEGPMVFCVISRYHGGAFVVFSNALNENLEVAALEGSYASVIGGAPAAAVVFAREVERRLREDPRMRELTEELRRSEGATRVRLQAQIEELSHTIHSEKLGEMAEEFDSIHSVERAQRVGSVHRIIPPGRLRPYLIDAVERGMQRTLAAGDETPLRSGAFDQL